MKTTALLVLAATMATFPAMAVDGIVLINQATLATSGGTYTITAPGSYKLSGNLQQKDKDTSVILIAADNVTIDLNGFSILGPADCSAGFPCKNQGGGFGIATPFPDPRNYFNITIRNGTIQGMGLRGIQVQGDSILVENMHVRGNAFDGIALSTTGARQQTNVIVRNNNVQQNGETGIFASSGQITDNVVTENGFGGIQMRRADFPALPTGIVARNVVTNNRGLGLELQGSVSYFGNALSGNGSGAPSNQVQGGFNQGQNLCGGGACPGAVF